MSKLCNNRNKRAKRNKKRTEMGDLKQRCCSDTLSDCNFFVAKQYPFSIPAVGHRRDMQCP